MKKYLLTVLALVATMMMACNPVIDDNTPANPETPETPETPEVVADYSITTSEALGGFLDYYGDDYECGLDDIALEIDAISFDDDGNPKTGKILMMQLFGELGDKTCLGTYSPDTQWANTGTFVANTYLAGVEFEGKAVGSAYMEMDMNTEEITAVECLVDGDLTIAMEGENYVVKGTLTTASGKIFKVDYTGALEYGDYTQSAYVRSLSVKKNFDVSKHFSTAAKFLKK